MLISIIKRHQFHFSVLILLIGLVWIGITAVYFEVPSNGQIPAPKEGFLAPDINLQGIDGATYQLSDLRGKAVIVNLWTSWCPPCKAEMPAMQKVFDTFKDQGFVILAVNATHQDTAAKAAQFAEDYDLSFPILLDFNGGVTTAYQIHSFPTSFFIDAEGLVKEIIIGGPITEALLQTRVKALLDKRE
jgi:peroxiredoxin